MQSCKFFSKPGTHTCSLYLNTLPLSLRRSRDLFTLHVLVICFSCNFTHKQTYDSQQATSMVEKTYGRVTVFDPDHALTMFFIFVWLDYLWLSICFQGFEYQTEPSKCCGKCVQHSCVLVDTHNSTHIIKVGTLKRLFKWNFPINLNNKSYETIVAIWGIGHLLVNYR